MSEDSWLSPAVLARLKGQAPIAPADALVKLGNSGEQQQRRSQELDHNDDVPDAGDDPDNRIDPDDRDTLSEGDDPDQSKAPQSPPEATAGASGIPSQPDLLDPAVLGSMPPKVAAFMLYEPPDPPAWRQKESEAERQWRETREADGAWAG